MKTVFTTEDMNFATYLLLQEVPITKVAPQASDPRYFSFTFEFQSQEQQWALTTMYQNGAVLVPAVPFGKALNRLKCMIWDAKKSKVYA